MKRCNACDEEFADKFSFCPVDCTPLNELAAALTGQQSQTAAKSEVSVRLPASSNLPRARVAVEAT